MPFIKLALVPEFGSTYATVARFGYLRAAELIYLGLPFNAPRAAELGLVTHVVPDEKLLPTATETAQELAESRAAALQACKRLMKATFRDQLEQAAKRENDEFAARVRSPADGSAEHDAARDGIHSFDRCQDLRRNHGYFCTRSSANHPRRGQCP
jgi:enoyl-CoA hydratase/carnithine racemase